MTQWRPITLILMLAGVVALSAWGLSGLTKHVILAVDKWGDAAPAKGHADAVITSAGNAVSGTASAAQDGIAKVALAAADGISKVAAVGPVLGQAVADTAGNINRPCRNKGGPDACGTLAEASKTMVRAGDAIVTTQLAERSATPHVIAAMDAFKDAAGGMKQNSDSLNDILRDDAIKRGLANMASMTDSWAGISADGKKVADKVTSDYLAPQPWWKKVGRYSGDAADVIGLAARHVP